MAPGDHVEGEINERIAGFYEDLRAVYPDFPPVGLVNRVQPG
jgi:hypothetical protein